MKNAWLKKRVEKSARDLAMEIRISRNCIGWSHDSRNFERKTILLFKYFGWLDLHRKTSEGATGSLENPVKILVEKQTDYLRQGSVNFSVMSQAVTVSGFVSFYGHDSTLLLECEEVSTSVAIFLELEFHITFTCQKIFFFSQIFSTT